MRQHFNQPAPLARRKVCAMLTALLMAFAAFAAASALTVSGAQEAKNFKRVAATSLAAETGTGVFDGQRAYAHVRKQVEFGPRPAGSEALARTRRYLTGELKSYGLRVTLDEFTAKTPLGRRRMANLTAELPGQSDEFILIASHYDTKLYRDFVFLGANDGGSSTGVLLELARVLAREPRRNYFTYRFVFFDGEEAFCREWSECGSEREPDNTYGSRRYVARLRERGELKRARALVLLDMVGYRELELGRDTSSTPWLVDLVWRAAHGLGFNEQFTEREEHVGGDDHTPFLAAGVPAVDLIQLDTYPHWHTPEDTLDKVSAESLRIVGQTVLAALPLIESKLREGNARAGAVATQGAWEETGF